MGLLEYPITIQALPGFYPANSYIMAPVPAKISFLFRDSSHWTSDGADLLGIISCIYKSFSVLIFVFYEADYRVISYGHCFITSQNILLGASCIPTCIRYILPT